MKGGLTMFQDVLIISVLVAIMVFLIASVMSLNSYWKKHNSLSEKKDEKFIMFCEILEDELESSLFGKQNNGSNLIEKKYDTINK
jgi:CBS domain containing-hemolysin-like protein